MEESCVGIKGQGEVKWPLDCLKVHWGICFEGHSRFSHGSGHQFLILFWGRRDLCWTNPKCCTKKCSDWIRTLFWAFLASGPTTWCLTSLPQDHLTPKALQEEHCRHLPQPLLDHVGNPTANKTSTKARFHPAKHLCHPAEDNWTIKNLWNTNTTTNSF